MQLLHEESEALKSIRGTGKLFNDKGANRRYEQ